MRKEVIVLLLLGILIISPLVLAQEQTQTYSGFGRFVDNVKIFFASGDNEVKLALEIREKEVASAIINSQNQGEDKAIKNLERAKQKLQIVQEKVSLDTSEQIKTSVDEITDKINDEENLPDEFDGYLLEEEKTQLTAILTEKTYEYCSELAKEDFALMLKDEECNPKTAPEPLKEDLEKLKDLQERMFVKLILEIRSCVDDPGTCNCEANEDIEEKAKCEKMVALALRCEYSGEEDACSELNSMEPPKAESFVSDFLMNLFRAKEKQMLWGDSPSDCVPEECWNENDKPECRQYDKFKETEADWDEYGNFIGSRDKCGREGQTLTMKESIPQCFDGDVFLEEKCGKITMVENEEGLINYLIGNEINGIIDDFENKSAQRTYAPGTYANGTMGSNGIMEIREGWMMENNEWVVDPGYRKMKEEINQIKNQIKNVTYALGTGPNVVIEGGAASGYDGLEWEVEGDVAGDSGGDDGLEREVKTYSEGDGTGKNEIVEDGEASGGEAYYDPTNDEVVTNNIDEAPGGIDSSDDGDCGDGVDCGDGSAEPGVESGVVD